MVYDKDEEPINTYQSDVRGRVQDRNVRVDLEPQFVLTYYEKIDPIKKIVYYDKMIEEFNARMANYKAELTLQFAESRRLEEEIMKQLDSLRFNNDLGK